MNMKLDKPQRPFLSAQWRHLVMLSYDIDPAILRPMVPVGTELDDYEGRTFVSVVGFMFMDTRVIGVAWPGHRTFEELNLRFYVRCKGPDGHWRRAVVFIKEIVPRRAVAWIARAVYGENYIALPMSHTITQQDDQRRVSYGWSYRGEACRLGVTVTGESHDPEAGSAEEFISEHYWGYTRTRSGRTGEYRVEHPRWRIWKAATSELVCDAAALYGSAFADVLREPASAFLADGSVVKVYNRTVLPR